ncbi:MAG: hypothetical protein ACRERU_03975 [Methylococcales bacterium]
MRTHYRGRNGTPGYHCAGKEIVQGRGVIVSTSGAANRRGGDPSVSCSPGTRRCRSGTHRRTTA